MGEDWWEKEKDKEKWYMGTFTSGTKDDYFKTNHFTPCLVKAVQAGSVWL